MIGTVDDLLVGLLEEALSALGEGDSALRARVLARLASALYFSASRERKDALTRKAVEMARRVGDPTALGHALLDRHFAMWGPENVEDRLAAATEMLKVAEQAGDREMALTSHSFRLVDLLEMGDIRAADREIEAYARLAAELRLPPYLWSDAAHKVMRALLEGRFEAVEQLARDALAIGQRVNAQTALQQFGIQMVTLRREQGRMQELEPAFRGFVEQYPAVPAWRTGLAYLYGELGRETEARVEFEQMAASDFADLPQDANWLIGVTLLSQVCAFLGDVRRASLLYQPLLPYAGRNVMVGSLVCTGSASRNLGLLAATIRRWEEAERHFEDALEMNGRMGSKPWVAWTQYEYSDMLLRRDSPGDREKALTLLSQAINTAQELGMKALLERALALKLKAQGIEPGDLRTSIDAVASAVYIEKPDLPPKTVAPDGTVTIMFSDIEGSTAMTERLGDKRLLELLREHNAIVRKQVKAHGGFEVKSEGDGFMIAFQSARRALGCAIELQRALAARNAKAREPIQVRVGLHTGEAIKEGEDFFGKNVILAARIAGQAKGGEILVSGLLKALVESRGDIEWGEVRTAELKGLSGAYDLTAVIWAGDAIQP